MRYFLSVVVLGLVGFACQTKSYQADLLINVTHVVEDRFDPHGQLIATRINPPEGYVRQNLDSSGFAYYLRHLPLKPNGASVKYFNGEVKSNQSSYCAVIDKKIGNRDLHQCADAIIRLKADYHFNRQEYDDIHFNFTNGFNAEYSKWRKGSRIKINNNTVQWINTNNIESDDSYWSYLEMVFAYAGTLSLSQELVSKNLSHAEIGDVLIQGGSPGHAMIIVDECIHPESGQKLYLLAQSYMPAQDIHIVNNLYENDLNPWYNLKNKEIIRTPEWTFYKRDLKFFDK